MSRVCTLRAWLRRRNTIVHADSRMHSTHAEVINTASHRGSLSHELEESDGDASLGRGSESVGVAGSPGMAGSSGGGEGMSGGAGLLVWTAHAGPVALAAKNSLSQFHSSGVRMHDWMVVHCSPLHILGMASIPPLHCVCWLVLTALQH